LVGVGGGWQAGESTSACGSRECNSCSVLLPRRQAAGYWKHRQAHQGVQLQRGKCHLSAHVGEPCRWKLGEEHRPGSHDDVESLSYSPNGRILVSAGDDRMINIWDAETFELKHTFEQEFYTNQATITADSNYIVSANRDKKVENYPLPRVSPHGTHPDPQSHSPHRLQSRLCVLPQTLPVNSKLRPHH